MKEKRNFQHSYFSHKITKLKILFLLMFISGGILFAEGEVTTITIESAQKTTYTKSEETGNDCIVLEGNVVVSVKKGTTTSDIKADIITYDRKTEMLYASGNVEITTKSASSGGETTTADSILINTATLEGVFDGGRVVQTQSDALNLPSGSTLIVFSDLFGKTESNTISFKNSSLTFCDAENPHWHIDATRTWLLPGGEFAFFNALLYVGQVPVIYLPAFYYPKDELLFNPVFTTYKRRGYAIQNTYYITGRKGLNNSSSSSSSDTDSSSAESLKALYNFMKPTSLKEQERQGLILHNLDEDYKGDTSKYLKVMADYYSNLGYMVGIDGVFAPSKKYITNLNFYVDLGFSKTVFGSGNNYTSIAPDGNVYWDSSNFMGLELPFRYGANLDLTLSKPFKLTLQMPIYSDPYFYYDFKDRNESMEWISYFLSSGDEKDSSESSYGGFSWNLKSSYSPTLPDKLKPYISSLSTSITSTLSFSSTSSKFDPSDSRLKVSGWQTKTPERSFYYPSQITPVKVSVSMNGTLVQWPVTSKSSSTSSKNEGIFAVPLIMPDELKTEKQLEKERQEMAKTSLENSGETEEKAAVSEEKIAVADEEKSMEPAPVFLSALPELSTTTTTVTVPGGLNYKLTYSIAPDLSNQINYDKSETPKDFEFDKVKSTMFTLKMPTSVSSSLNYGGSYFSMNNKISYDPTWQNHPNKDGVTESEKKSLTLADYKASSQTISNTNSISIKPFAYVPTFADTSLSWNTSIRIFKYEFIGDSKAENWEEAWKSKESWNDYWIFTDYFDSDNWADSEDSDAEKSFKQKFITANSLNLTLAANEGNSKFKQNLNYALTLPPQYWKHTLSLNLTFPYVTNSFSWSATQSNTDADDDGKLDWTMNNLTQSASISLFDSKLKFTESFSMITDKDKIHERDEAVENWNKNYDSSDKKYINDFEKFLNYSDSLRLSLNWQKLTASYVMSYTTGYDLDPNSGKGWEARSIKQFLPYTLSLSYSPTTKTYYRWSNKLSFAPSLSTSVTADLIKPTSSYFLFTPALNFKINKLLDLSFSASSRNSTLYWYFQDDGIYSDLGNNFASKMFIDLFRSFGFGDKSFRTNRENSGFKLKSLNMTASHDLHDWAFTMSIKMEPKIVTVNNKKDYNFDPSISIAVVWNPMNSMKAAIVSEYDDDIDEVVWKLNP